MTDEGSSSQKGESKRRQNGKKGTPQQNSQQSSKGRKEKNPDQSSTTSSSTPSTPKLPKFQLLKRNVPHYSAQGSVQSVQMSPPPLMEVERKQQNGPTPLMEVNTTPTFHSTPTKNWGIEVSPEDNMNLSMKQASANKKQRNVYYFSEKPGTAVSVNEFQDSVQYKRNNFPLDMNVDILIEKKFNLMITPTTGRCKALYIRVKSPHPESTFSTGALLKVDADDREIRKACDEVITNYCTDRTPLDRYPFCEASEPFLSTCFIRRLDERQDAFPEAIYYCEKCDYHINTMSHAKAHLESSTHFEDVERQQQRQKLLEMVPEPSEAHLEAVRNLLRAELDSYQSIKKDGEERIEKVLDYLSTQLFVTIKHPEVQLEPFGSATYDVVLPDSDFNVAFTTVLPEGEPLFAFLEKIRKQINEDGYQADHSMDMGTSSTIIFTFESTRVRLCWLSSFNHRGQLHFSQLMKAYTSLRPEVTEFLQLIRLWATKAQVDSKNGPRIGLPRYGFDILVVHYLQQSGYLPVLHELYRRDSEEKLVTSEEKEDDGKEEDRPQTPEKVPLDDASNIRNQPEEARQRRVRLASRYLKDRQKVLAAFPALEEPWDLARLWIGFFRYYVKHNREVVVQITQMAAMNRDHNKWNKKILHVMDPFRSDNVLSIPKVSTWQPYYFNCLLATFLSFAVARNKKGPLMEWTLVQNKTVSSKKKKESSFGTPKRITTTVDTPKATPLMSQITEEEYNNAADLLAEEEELIHHDREVLNRISFDGIKANDLKMEDVEIDEHFEQRYSKRTAMRVRRVYPADTNWDMMQHLANFGILSRKWEKKLFRKNRRQQLAVNTEAAQEGPDSTSEPPTPSNVQVCTVMFAHARIADDKPKVEKFPFGSYQTDLLDVSVLASEQEGRLQKKQSTPSSDELPKVNTATFAGRSSLRDTTKENRICTEEFFIREKYIPSNADFKARVEKMKADDYFYQFTPESFSNGYEMEMKCTHCDGSHCVENCPMMEIPPIEKFPPRSSEDLTAIDEIIDKYYKENVLDESRLTLLQEKVKELETYLRGAYRNDVCLTIFGSVMTGLSVNCSDIDICLRFGTGDEPPKELTPKGVIQKTEEKLRKCPLTKNVQAITTAKVPIVKFQMRLSTSLVVDVDISYYNILALYNTRLLREYTNWTPDHRFAKLALFIKSWAKSCDIGDASRGSLSSYAHIILLVSYLQQCDPPVLPRLQEDFRSGNTDKRIVENWDTAFVEAEKTVLQKWPKNKETCAQLLIGYFDYYSRFDFRNFVVQCRREMILCKMEKEWPKPLCVEDPFDLNHNLSSGVTKKMFVFVMKVFIASRAVFMSLEPSCPRDGNFLANFREQLFAACSQGTAPTDRQCHLCHRIGHFYESCPQRKERKRYGSNSTNSSYRSAGNNQNVGGFESGVERISYHKRPYNRRFNR